MHPVLWAVGGWIVAQPLLCVAWAHVMRFRRAAGGN